MPEARVVAVESRRSARRGVESRRIAAMPLLPPSRRYTDGRVIQGAIKNNFVGVRRNSRPRFATDPTHERLSPRV